MNKFNYYLHEISKSVSTGIIGYLKATLKLSLLGFIILSVGLWFFHVKWWFVIAFLIAVVDMLPVVGSGIVMIPWALIPAAAICNVSPFELARRNLVPVVIGLIVTTIVAMFII